MELTIKLTKEYLLAINTNTCEITTGDMVLSNDSISEFTGDNPIGYFKIEGYKPLRDEGTELNIPLLPDFDDDERICIMANEWFDDIKENSLFGGVYEYNRKIYTAIFISGCVAVNFHKFPTKFNKTGLATDRTGKLVLKGSYEF